MKKIEEYVRSIPDFPEPGIIFRDVTSILQDADGLKLAIDSMSEGCGCGCNSGNRIPWIYFRNANCV